jgi:hypothetical protein
VSEWIVQHPVAPLGIGHDPLKFSAVVLLLAPLGIHGWFGMAHLIRPSGHLPKRSEQLPGVEQSTACADLIQHTILEEYRSSQVAMDSSRE